METVEELCYTYSENSDLYKSLAKTKADLRLCFLPNGQDQPVRSLISSFAIHWS